MNLTTLALCSWTSCLLKRQYLFSWFGGFLGLKAPNEGGLFHVSMVFRYVFITCGSVNWLSENTVLLVFPPALLYAAECLLNQFVKLTRTYLRMPFSAYQYYMFLSKKEKRTCIHTDLIVYFYYRKIYSYLFWN